MEREGFLKLLAERFYPLLREEGFRGSGTTLRRVREAVVHIVNVQGSTSADGFYINLGAHLTFLPMEGGGVVVAGRLKEYECAFRDRLDPPLPRGSGRWRYGRSPSDAEAAIVQVISEWRGKGQAFFRKYSAYPDDFRELIRVAGAAPLYPRHGLTYARIALRLGLREEARVLASHSLEHVSPAATGLRALLKRLLEELEAA
jgi:hypothetical protein